MTLFNLFRTLDMCSAAELPEKLNVDERDLHVVEDRRYNSKEEAQAACSAAASANGHPAVVVLEALVPKLPQAAAKAMEDYRTKLPKLKEKLKSLLEIDPETGVETWLERMHRDILARTKARPSKQRKCDHCKSMITMEFINEYPQDYKCPVCKTFNFMETDGDITAIATRTRRIEELRTEIAQGDETLKRMEAEGLKNATDYRRAWLAFRKEEEVISTEVPPLSEDLPEVPAAAAPEEERPAPAGSFVV